MKGNNKPKIIKLSAVLLGELLVIIMWGIYFLKFDKYYYNVDMLISDNQPLIDRMLIFVTYSKKDSVLFFGGGFLVVFLLVVMATVNIQIDRRTFEKTLSKKLLILVVIVNVGLVATLLKPIVYPIFIVFFFVSYTVVTISQTFNPIIELDDDDYEEDEESSGEIDGKATND